MAERICGECRWWNELSNGQGVGDCMHKPDGTDGHRAYRCSSALLDSFGPEETKATHSCSFWVSGNSK